MRVEIDRNRCEGHGLCEQLGPLVYQLDEEGEVVLLHDESIPIELQDEALSGARACPVAALSVHL